MADHYAWSPIRTTVDGKEKSFARGAKVTQNGLGVSDADWDALVQAGAIRPKKFPAPDDYEGSAVDWLRDKLREAQEMSGIEEEEAASELAEVASPPDPEETLDAAAAKAEAEAAKDKK